MADKVLTTGSTMNCPHGFAVTFASKAALRVGGNQVVRSSDLVDTQIACTVQTPCKTIALFKPSTLLSDGGSPVVLVTGIQTNIGPCQNVVAGHELLETD
jgi:hypothetical protein